jgi:hypothetical protein
MADMQMLARYGKETRPRQFEEWFRPSDRLPENRARVVYRTREYQGMGTYETETGWVYHNGRTEPNEVVAWSPIWTAA